MFKQPLSALDFASMQYSEIIAELQTGRSLVRALQMDGKTDNVFRRLHWKMAVWRILLLIRWRTWRYGDDYDFLVRDSIVDILSRVRPAKYCGKKIGHTCQIYADSLASDEKICIFGMTLFNAGLQSLVVPVSLAIYESLAKYARMLELSDIKLLPVLSTTSLNALSEDTRAVALRISDILANGCLLAIAEQERRSNTVVLGYDLGDYSLTPSSALIDQDESLLRTFASAQKLDVFIEPSDVKYSWHDFRQHYLIEYAERQA